MGAQVVVGPGHRSLSMQAPPGARVSRRVRTTSAWWRGEPSRHLREIATGKLLRRGAAPPTGDGCGHVFEAGTCKPTRQSCRSFAPQVDRAGARCHLARSWPARNRISDPPQPIVSQGGRRCVECVSFHKFRLFLSPKRTFLIEARPCRRKLPDISRRGLNWMPWAEHDQAGDNAECPRSHFVCENRNETSGRIIGHPAERRQRLGECGLAHAGWGQPFSVSKALMNLASKDGIAVPERRSNGSRSLMTPHLPW